MVGRGVQWPRVGLHLMAATIEEEKERQVWARAVKETRREGKDAVNDTMSEMRQRLMARLKREAENPVDTQGRPLRKLIIQMLLQRGYDLQAQRHDQPRHRRDYSMANDALRMTECQVSTSLKGESCVNRPERS